MMELKVESVRKLKAATNKSKDGNVELINKKFLKKGKEKKSCSVQEFD